VSFLPLHPNFAIIGTLIGAAGTLAYLIDTLKGKVQPNRVSFLLWCFAPMIAFAAQMQQGVGIEALMTFSTGFLPLLVFGATFINKKSVWQISKFDLVCGVLSLIGLALWLITKVGNVAIFFSIVADGLAAIPTIVKAYFHPETESAWPWVATSFGVLLTLLSIESLNFANAGFITYIMLVNLVIFFLVQTKIGQRVSTPTITAKGST
jgi:hypothetical protein